MIWDESFYDKDVKIKLHHVSFYDLAVECHKAKLSFKSRNNFILQFW